VRKRSECDTESTPPITELEQAGRNESEAGTDPPLDLKDYGPQMHRNLWALKEYQQDHNRIMHGEDLVEYCTYHESPVHPPGLHRKNEFGTFSFNRICEGPEGKFQ
jgi:hypothetical protein